MAHQWGNGSLYGWEQPDAPAQKTVIVVPVGSVSVSDLISARVVIEQERAGPPQIEAPKPRPQRIELKKQADGTYR